MTSSPVAFVPGTQVARARQGEGTLSGTTFAVKDLFDIRGHAPSAGLPAWARTHAPAQRDAPVIAQLLRAGADLVGVTIMDELAYSLAGQNPHYGTPHNPRVAQRLCGGSSCGSAAAVAACLCDFALGTDAGGSVRVPASFCGLFGLRPTHGAISSEGAVPLAPSFDTVGFFAREARTFERVASVLLGNAEPVPPTRLLVAVDAFARMGEFAESVLDAALARIAKAFGLQVEPVRVAPEGFDELRTAFRRLQAREAYAAHAAWLREVRPELSPAVAERFRMAEQIAHSDEGKAHDPAVRAALRERLTSWLEPNVLLCLPPTASIAPRLDEQGPELEAFRAHTLELTCLASLSGVPQLVIPASELEGAPLGLSFMAAHGADAWLSSLASSFEAALTSSKR